MQITQQKWSDLLVKFWNQTINKAERAELDRQRASSKAKDHQFNRVSRLDWWIARLKDMDEYDVEENWKGILEKISSSSPASTPPPVTKEVPNTRPVNTPRWITKRTKRYLVAALAAGVLAMIATQFIMHKKATQVVQNNIAALPNKAELRWHNGKHFLLDQTSDGILLQADGTQLYKKNGIVYIKGISVPSDPSILYNEMILPEGSHYKLSLPDGTLVWMNASSKIRFPTRFSGGIRKVEIQGQAFLEIAHNPNTPFLVGLNDKLYVKAVGTRFMVRSYPGEDTSRVSLIDGEVGVMKPLRPGRFTYIKPNQQYKSTNQQDTVVTSQEPLQDVQALMKGQFNLGKDLRAVLLDIGKWYGIPVSYHSGIENPILNGQIDRLLPLSEILCDLEKSTRLKIKFVNQTIIVTAQ
jgi:hypothetical protein